METADKIEIVKGLDKFYLKIDGVYVRGGALQNGNIRTWASKEAVEKFLEKTTQNKH